MKRSQCHCLICLRWMERMLSPLLHLTKIFQERHYYSKTLFFIFYFYYYQFLILHQSVLFLHESIRQTFFVSFSYYSAHFSHYNLFLVICKTIILKFKHFGVINNIINLNFETTINYCDIKLHVINNANNFMHMHYASFKEEVRINWCCYLHFVFSLRMKIIFLVFKLNPYVDNQYSMLPLKVIISIIKSI